VRLLHPGLVREALEEPLTRLVEPISNLLGNLRMQRLKLLVPLPQVQGERRSSFLLMSACSPHTLLALRVGACCKAYTLLRAGFPTPPPAVVFDAYALNL